MAADGITRKRKAMEDACLEVDSVSKRATKSRKTAKIPSHSRSSTRSSKPSELPQAKSSRSIVPPSAIRSEEPKRNKRQRSPEPAETPKHKRTRSAVPPTPEETPTRGASKLFDLLNLAQQGSVTSFSKKLQSYQSPPDTPHKQSLNQSSGILPAAVQELKDQYAALLQAQSLFVTHYGAGHPNYLHELVTRMTKTWRKRAVHPEDIERLLGLMGDACPYKLVDNGEGAICLETKDGHEDATHRTAPYLADFERRLHKRWSRWAASADPSEDNEQVFIEGLPHATSVRSEVSADPRKRERGAALLADIKGKSLTATNQQATRKIESIPESAKTASAITSRGASLLDRILTKQSLAASGPDAPTKAENERRAAVDRVEDVARVLDFLAGSRSRASFSMQDLVQKLQNSMRNPIAKDEAELCLTIMAAEVCPTFVKVIKSGGLNCIVVMKLGRPDGEDLKDRLDKLRG